MVTCGVKAGADGQLTGPPGGSADGCVPGSQRSEPGLAAAPVNRVTLSSPCRFSCPMADAAPVCRGCEAETTLCLLCYKVTYRSLVAVSLGFGRLDF